MKKINYPNSVLTSVSKTVILFFTMLLISSGVWAQILVNQDFTAGTSGNAVTVSPISWATNAGGGNGTFTLANSTALTISGYNSAGGNYLSVVKSTSGSSTVGQAFSATAGTNTFYYSFLLNVSTTTTTDYFASLSTTTSSGSFFARLFLKTAAGGYNLGISKASGTGIYKGTPTLLTTGTTYLIVVKYTYNTGSATDDQVYMWINPTITSEPLIANAEISDVSGSDGTALSSNGAFILRNNTTTPSYTIDGIKVAVGSSSSSAWTNLAASSTGPTVDGTISTNEYGTHTDGNNQQANGGSSTVTYMTWDNTNLYVGVSGATVSEGYVLYLDKDPQIPVNGGTNANGTNVGNNYDGESFAALPFRADMVIYAKNGYREYRTADGSNGWSSANTAFGSYADNSGTKVREFSIPWSSIGGMPASFNWFGFATSSSGFVYGGTPVENPGGIIGTSARYERYYTVSTTTVGSSTMPFSRNSFVFNNTADETGFGAISVYDFTMNSPGRFVSRTSATSGNWTVNGNMVVGAGTVYFGSGGSTYGTTTVNNVNVMGGALNMDNTTTAMTVGGNLTMSSGSLTLSAQVGGDLNLAGNWNTSGGAFTHNSRQVQFNGASSQTLTGSGTTAFGYLKMNNSTGLTLQTSSPISVAGVLTLTSGNITLNGNNLTMGASATVSGGSSSSYVVTSSSGNYIATTAATQATCPIGNSSIYAPLKITGTGTSDTYATYLTSTLPCAPTDATKVVNLAWGITSASQIPASVVYQWNTTDQAGSFIAAGTCDIGRYNSACPYNIAAIGSAAGTSPNTITASTGLASGSNIYVLGNTNAVYYVTPVLSTNGTSSLTFSSGQTVGTQTASQTFNLSGSNLTGSPGNITVTAPSTDFQVSNNNSSWGATATVAYSSATLASTPVYVRFSPQSTGAKSGNLTFSGGGVGSPPTISLTGTAVTGTLSTNGTSSFTFANQVSLTQSASQTFNLSGANLLNGSGNITVNAPSTDFQVSNNNSTWGASATIAYSSTTLSSTPVYVRFTPQSVGAKSGNITFSGGNVGTPPTISLTGSGSLATPVATAATSYTSTGFNTNWGAITGASAGYLLDVSTSPNFVPAGTATATEGFESGMPTSAYSTGAYTLGTGTWSLVNILRCSSPINSGNYSCQMQGNTSSSITSPSYNGMGTVTLYVQPGTFNTTVTVSKIVGGVTTLLQTISLTGGAAFAQYIINVNDNTNGIQLFVQNTGTKVAYLDDISIVYNTTASTFVPGYNALSVPGQSTITKAVTGLTPGIYYYRLRATDGTNISAYSDTVSVTIQDPSVANYQSAASGNYSSAATWNYDVTGSGNYIAATQAPGANNSVTVQSGHVVTLTANQTINTGKTVTVSSGGAMNDSTFNFNGAGNVTVSPGGLMVSRDPNGINGTGATGSVQVTGTRSFSSLASYGFSASGTGNTGNFFATTTPVANTVLALGIGNNAGAGTITYNGSASSINVGTLVLYSGSFNLGSANTVNIANGGGVQGYGGSMATTGTGGQDGGNITFLSGASASTITYPTSSSATFYNININSGITGGVNLGGSATTINGTLKINGSFVQSASAPTYSANSTLNYNTGGAYTASNEWATNTGSGAGVPQNVSTTTSGTSLNFGAGTAYHQMSGNMSIGASTTFALSSAAGGDLYIKGIWTDAGTFTPNTAAVNFNGSSAQTIAVTGGGTETFAYMLINNPANVILSSSPATNLSVSATTGDVLQLTNGKLDLNGKTLTFTADGGNIKVTGSRTITSATAATISVQGNKSVTYAASGNILTLDTNVTTVLQGKFLDFGNPASSNYTYINGKLQINASGYVANYAPYYNPGSTLVYNTGGPYSPAKEWYENTFITQPGIPYNVTLSNNTSLNFNGHGYPFEMWGNLSITAGSSFALNTAGTPNPDLFVKGNWSNAGTFIPNGHLVKFDGTSAQTITGATTFDYLQMANSAGLTLNNDATVTTQLILTSGSITTGSNNVIVTGTSATSVTGYSSSNYIKGNLRRYITVLTSYDFPVGTSSTYELATVNDVSLVGTTYLTGSFSSTIGGTTVNPASCVVNNRKMAGLLNGGIWTITPDAQPTSGTYDVTLNMTGLSNAPASQTNQYGTVVTPAQQIAVIKRHDASSAWEGTGVNSGYVLTGGVHNNSDESVSGSTASAKRTLVTSFSDFGIGTEQNNSWALPVELISFTAVAKDNNAVLNWSTASEINNDHFDVESSVDGESFTKIDEIKGNGTTNQMINYQAVDKKLAAYGSSVVYYRLKQVDFDSHFKYTNIASVNIGQEKGNALNIISTYPNPFADHFNISFYTTTSQTVKVAVYDLRGELVSTETITADGGMNVYKLSEVSKLAAGFYTVNMSTAGESHSFKMLKGE